MSYTIEVTNKDGDQEQLVAVDKGYIDGKEIVLTEDGRTFENTPTAGLIEFEGQEPFALAAEEEPADDEATDGEDEQKENGYTPAAHADRQGDPPSHQEPSAA